MPTFTDFVPKIVEGDDRTNFESAVELYLPAIESKVCVCVCAAGRALSPLAHSSPVCGGVQMSEHLDWTIDNLPLALGHKWFGLRAADLLLGWIEFVVPDFVLPNLPPLHDPGAFSVKSTRGVVRTLSLSADQLAMYVYQNIMRRYGGSTQIVQNCPTPTIKLHVRKCD
jgi:hypothetical protein